MTEDTPVPGEGKPVSEDMDGFIQNANAQIGWYWDECEKYEFRLSLSTWVGIISGVLATVFAAYPSTVFSDQNAYWRDIIKWLVVLFSALATVANSTLVPRYRRLAETRESGRIKSILIVGEAEASRLPEKRRGEAIQRLRELMAVETEHGGVDAVSWRGSKGEVASKQETAPRSDSEPAPLTDNSSIAVSPYASSGLSPARPQGKDRVGLRR